MSFLLFTLSPFFFSFSFFFFSFFSCHVVCVFPSFCLCGIRKLEFPTNLSAFLKITVFEQVTKNAVRGLWARRSKLNLVGAHINIFTGEWTQKVTLLLVWITFTYCLPSLSNLNPHQCKIWLFYYGGICVGFLQFYYIQESPEMH